MQVIIDKLLELKNNERLILLRLVNEELDFLTKDHTTTINKLTLYFGLQQKLGSK